MEVFNQNVMFENHDLFIGSSSGAQKSQPIDGELLEDGFDELVDDKDGDEKDEKTVKG